MRNSINRNQAVLLIISLTEGRSISCGTIAASAKTITFDDQTGNGDWKVVLTRRSKQKKNFCKTKNAKVEHHWVPVTLKSDPDGQMLLMKKMQICIQKVEKSPFFEKIMAQIQTPEVQDSFRRALDNHLKILMVIYGIGRIELYENPRLQLSVAILMKQKLNWTGDIEVFDRVFSAMECKVLEALGCIVLSTNEHGRRRATKPMLFYMPHCEAELYNNPLEANWEVEYLNHIALFGNSFMAYQCCMSEFKNSTLLDSTSLLLCSRSFTSEYKIETVADDYFAACHDSSWHFFTHRIDADLQV